MNKLTLGSLVLLLLLFHSTSFAEYRLECQNELSLQWEVVIVKEANNLKDAVQRIRLDPNYGYYNYRTCKDAQIEITWEPGFDRNGSDYKSYTGEAGAKSCQESCINDPKCKAWTYVKPRTFQGPSGRCWLKYSQPRKIPKQHCISGIVNR